MSKKVINTIDDDAFAKLTEANKNTAIKPKFLAVTQKVVQVRESQRDSEHNYALWINKKLYKRLQGLAIDENTNVKELLCEAGRETLRSRGITWGPDQEK